jgi:tetratricopeptide (TPR) repeat protein
MMRLLRLGDARQFERLKTYYIVKYRVVKPQESQRTVVSTIKDIAEGGLHLKTKEPLTVSAVIELQIHFLATNDIVKALAKVVWVKEVGRGGSYEAGVSFLPSSDAQLYYNIGIVYKLQRKMSRAKTAFKKALSVDPNFEAAKKELETGKAR